MDPRDSIVDAGVAVAFLEQAVLPFDTVNYQRPGYWDRPFVNSDVVDVPPTIVPGAWTSVLTQRPPEDPYTLILQCYTLTTAEPLPPTGVQFRIVTEAGSLSHTRFAEGVERHRSDNFPLRPVELFHPVTTSDSIILQVRNMTATSVRVLASLMGWYMWAPDSAGELDNILEGMTDV